MAKTTSLAVLALRRIMVLPSFLSPSPPPPIPGEASDGVPAAASLASLGRPQRTNDRRTHLSSSLAEAVTGRPREHATHEAVWSSAREEEPVLLQQHEAVLARPPVFPSRRSKRDRIISSTGCTKHGSHSPSNDSHTVPSAALASHSRRRSPSFEAQQSQAPGRFTLTRCAPSNRPDEPIQAAYPPEALHKPKRPTRPCPAAPAKPQALGELLRRWCWCCTATATSTKVRHPSLTRPEVGS